MKAAWLPTRSAAAMPTGVTVAIGAAVVVATVVLVAGVVAPSAPAVRLAVLAVVLGNFAALTADLTAALCTAGIAWLLLNGFLVNELGTLSWHGTADVWRAAVLAGAAVLGWLVPVFRPERRSRREIRRLRTWLDREAVALLTHRDKEASPRG